MTTEHDKFMDAALAEARAGEAEGNTPVGSVIVRDGAVIGVGRNRVNSDYDPTAHAEVDAIRDACRKLSVSELAGSVCYTTMEPCPMCCWAIEAAGCTGLVMGARHRDFSGPGVRNYESYTVEAMIDMTGAGYEVVTDVQHKACCTMRQAWYDKQ